MLAGLEGRREAVQQRGGNGFGVAAALQAREQDNEFIAAQSGDGVDIAQVFLQPLGDALEQQVPDRVSKAVIDVLETVQIKKQHCADALRFGAVSKGCLQAVLEQCAVRQTGQWVVVRLIVELRLSVFKA